MIDLSTSATILKALKSQFVAQKDTALAQMLIYLQNPVGVGDHPAIVNELLSLTREVAEADDCLAALDRYFVSNPPPPPTLDE